MTGQDTLEFLVTEGLVFRDEVGPRELLVSAVDATRWVLLWPDRTLVSYGTWPPIPTNFGEVTEFLISGRLPRTFWED